MRIGIVIGSIRDGRKGEAVGRWVAEQASSRTVADYEVLDLRELDVPLLTDAEPPGAADKEYDSPQVQAWSRAVSACDGFVFVTPEYNHGIPGAFKNAFDSLWPEWTHKAVAFVSYGSDGGVRAVEAWRPVVAAAMMVGVRATVSLGTFTDWDEERFTPQERRAEELAGTLDAVEQMTGTLLPLRG